MSDITQQKRFIQIRSLSASSAYTEREDNLGIIIDMMKDSPVGDGYELRVVEMAEDEYRALPEFMGW